MAMINMANSLVFLNCDLGIEPIIYSKMSDISNVSEAVRGSGLYNRVANVTNKDPGKHVARSVKEISAIATINSSLTMILFEQNASKQIEVAH